ncbi:MAG: C2 family cysteine protease [Lysobacteraceae bacterium]
MSDLERERQYTDARLYGPGGQPQPADIRQDSYYDCYLLAPMGALVSQQPDRIHDAIRYQPDPNTPNAGVFSVTMHHPTRGVQQIEVSQADVDYNIRRHGGSTADNHDGGPIWPAVMEAAFAKMHDPHPENDDRSEGYSVIGRQSGGGTLSDGMFALTGEAGQNLRIGERPPPGSSHGTTETPPPFRKPNGSTYVSEGDAYTGVRVALASDRPVSLSTLGKEVNDGLMESHAYTVTDIQQRDGHTWVTLRNPYAHNQQDGASERGDTASPTTIVRLDQMASSGALGEINVGPAPRGQSLDGILVGEARPDRMQGGIGQDTYIVGRNDTVMDSDGHGELRWGGRALTGGTRTEGDPPNTYRSADGEYTYALAGTTLSVSNRAGESMQVEQYARGDLGLRLEDPPVRTQNDALPGPQPGNGALDRLSPQDRAVYDRMFAATEARSGAYTQEQRENIAAAGLSEFKRRDGVVQQAQDVGIYGDRLFAAYFPHGQGNEPNFHANVRLDEAANTPARESLQQVEALTQQRAIVQPVQQMEQQQGQGGPAIGARGL